MGVAAGMTVLVGETAWVGVGEAGGIGVTDGKGVDEAGGIGVAACRIPPERSEQKRDQVACSYFSSSCLISETKEIPIKWNPGHPVYESGKQLILEIWYHKFILSGWVSLFLYTFNLFSWQITQRILSQIAVLILMSLEMDEKLKYENTLDRRKLCMPLTFFAPSGQGTSHRFFRL